MAVSQDRFPLCPNREQKDKSLSREHFGSGLKQQQQKRSGTLTLLLLWKNFTPPCMSLLSIFSDCTEGHQMHNVKDN